MPDPERDGQTPLMAASTPSLDALAKCGCCGSIEAVDASVPLSPSTGVLSLLGYDFQRGVVPSSVLKRLGSQQDFPYSELRLFVVPKFSGHGVVISDSAEVRGAAVMGMMKPVFPMGEGVVCSKEHSCGSLVDKAALTIRAIEIFDFVLVYVGEPEAMALAGDPDGKVEAIEKIDRELITPVADYVWNAKMQMNLVVTGDYVTSWQDRRRLHGEVPAVVYFNDDLPYDLNRFDEESVKEGPLNAPLPGDLILLLISFEPLPEEER